MQWKILLALLKGKSIDEELCRIIDYILEENLTYRKRHGSLRDLTNKERFRLSELARHITKANFESICTIWKPETMLGWYRKILRQSHVHKKTISKGGRPSTLPEIEEKLIKIATENRLWGYGKLQGALRNLGHEIAKSTIQRILRRHGIPPIKDRMKRSKWHEFIKANKEVLFAGDFFTVDILSFGGVKTYYVLFFIHISSRKVYLGGVTEHPNESWMCQVARNMTMTDEGPMRGAKYLILDRDSSFSKKFKGVLKSGGIDVIHTPLRSSDLNAFTERWVRSVREECLDHLIILREESLRYAIREYIVFYNGERNHQGAENQLLSQPKRRQHERLGGMLRYYGRDAA